MYGRDVDVAYRISPYSTRKSVMLDYYHSHRVTGSLAVWSQSWVVFWTVTGCNPGRSYKYGTYCIDHPLGEGLGRAYLTVAYTVAESILPIWAMTSHAGEKHVYLYFQEEGLD